MRPPASRETRVCISIAARPGNAGTRFHNALYDELGLDFVYQTFAVTDLVGAITGVRALGLRGCSVSMPFKQAVLDLVDEVAPSAAALGAANTIINEDGRLTAYNTDVLAVATLIAGLDSALPTVVRGAGGMARAVVSALGDRGFTNVTVVGRDTDRRRAVADLIGAAEADAVPAGAAALINATPLGMEGAPEASVQAFSDDELAAARWVLDVVALPPETPLVAAARRLGIEVATGAEVTRLQAIEQFALYTGVRPTPEQVQRASRE